MSKSSGHPAIGVDQGSLDEPHLRSVLETQPVVLVRLGRDGTFLAVNESAMSALGAERLDQLLGTSISGLLPPDERNALQLFLDRISTGHRGSLEIDLTALTGTRHTMQLHAAPHPGAPDGIESLLVTLRDVTESRRLEQSLVEAMARQTEQEAAHEVERARLAAELAGARKLGVAAEANEIAALERKLAEAAELRAALSLQHAAEVEGLTEALEERTRISDEQAAKLNEAAATAAHLKAELEDVIARHDAALADADAARKALDGARAATDEAVREVTGRYEADVLALKDALNQAMEDQARLADQSSAQEQAASEAHARVDELERAVGTLQQSTDDTIRGLEARIAALDREAEATVQAHEEAEAAHRTRVALLEATLASARTAEQQLTARFASLTEAADRVAHEARKLATAIAGGAGGAEGASVSAGALAGRIERPLGDVLGKSIALAVLVAAPETMIAAPADRVEQALVALAVNRGSAMRSGQMAVEIADVTVDEDAAMGHGGMAPGDYALIAVHVTGEGASDGLEATLFESSSAEAWGGAKPELAAAREATRASGGLLWLTHEGRGVVFELYLPRQVSRETR